MHRILLYGLVVALLVLAWDARRGEVLATGRSPGDAERAEAPRAAGAEAPPLRTMPWAALVPARAPTRTFADPELQARLEARVEASQSVWTTLLEPPVQGPPAEDVLSGAEAWVEASFPEGGSTAKLARAEDRRTFAPEGVPEGVLDLAGADVPGGAAADPLAVALAEAAGGASEPVLEPAPIYLASLARIESLDGDLPAWCGLLDLALQPAGAHQGLDAARAGAGWEAGETVWISDERGRLLARVEALDGFGLELDPTWPWIARQRRLFWSETGVAGLSAHQYRLVLEGGSLVPSWSGRLVLLRAQPARQR